MQRTRQLLRGALFSLIQEKGFEALSVQDIIDHANVGRATFYAHFDNKEDLLLTGFDGLRASLRQNASATRSRAGVVSTSGCSRSATRCSRTPTSIATCFERWWASRAVP